MSELLFVILGAVIVYASCYQETMRHATRTGSRKKAGKYGDLRAKMPDESQGRAREKAEKMLLAMPARKEARNHG